MYSKGIKIKSSLIDELRLEYVGYIALFNTSYVLLNTNIWE